MSCPNDSALLEYATNPANGERGAAVALHIESCAGCRAMVQALRPQASTEPFAAAAGEQLLPRGTNVGRYVVLEHLGSGGMGVVYSAYDPELDRKVALKLIRAAEPTPDTATSRERLLREAQAMARLAHPNVVHVYDVGVWNERVFVAMELVEGETLSSWLKRHAGDWRQALALLIAAGRGLAAAHAAGLVHRDFKPDNVLIGRDGRAHVTDFGVARPAGAPAPRDDDVTQSPGRLHQRLTHTGALLGTPAYMAPEQFHGGPSDARGDLFSFCVALYEALYGRRPFEGNSIVRLAAQIATGQIKEPASTTVPARLRVIVLRGLSAEPEQRFATMDALLAELTWDPAARRRRWLAAVAAIAVTGALVGAGFALRRFDRRVCNDGSAQLAAAWDDARIERVRGAFLATGAPYAATTFGSVRSELDRFAGAWRAMHLEACEATRIRDEQSAELLDLRMQCLDDKRRGLEAMTDLFSHADANVVEHAVSMTVGLGGLEPCADGRSLRASIVAPANPALEQRLDRLRDRLAAARAALDAGKIDDALAAAPALVQGAQALHDRPLESETLLLLGQAQLKKGRSDAEKTLKQAELTAEASRHDRVAAQSWIQLVSAQNDTVVEHQAAADESGRHAEAFLARLPPDDRLRVELSLALSKLDTDEGKWDDGRREIERGLAAARRAYGDEHPMVAACLQQLGIILGGDEGEAAIRHALAINAKVLGADHPQTAGSYYALGATLVGIEGWKKNDEAIAAYRHGIAIFEKIYGPGSVKVALGSSRLSDLVGARDHAGDLDEAVALQKRAIAIYRAINPAGREVGKTLALLAGLYIDMRQETRALELLDEAQAILEPALGKNAPVVGWLVYRLRGNALAQAHRYDEAAASFEQTLTTSIANGNRAAVKFALAQALWETGRPAARSRALALTMEVRPLFAQSKGQDHVWLARVDKWLQEHKAPR